MLKGFVRVTRTERGKNGIGLEVEVNGMKVYDDLTKDQQEWFKKNGFRWMKANYEEKNGKWVKTREGFFYKSFSTKAERDNMAKALSTKIVGKEKTKSKKTEAKKAETKKDLSKMTKKELVAYIESLGA